MGVKGATSWTSESHSEERSSDEASPYSKLDGTASDWRYSSYPGDSGDRSHGLGDGDRDLCGDSGAEDVGDAGQQRRR